MEEKIFDRMKEFVYFDRTLDEQPIFGMSQTVVVERFRDAKLKVNISDYNGETCRFEATLLRERSSPSKLRIEEFNEAVVYFLKDLSKFHLLRNGYYFLEIKMEGNHPYDNQKFRNFHQDDNLDGAPPDHLIFTYKNENCLSTMLRPVRDSFYEFRTQCRENDQLMISNTKIVHAAPWFIRKRYPHIIESPEFESYFARVAIGDKIIDETVKATHQRDLDMMYIFFGETEEALDEKVGYTYITVDSPIEGTFETFIPPEQKIYDDIKGFKDENLPSGGKKKTRKIRKNKRRCTQKRRKRKRKQNKRY